MAPDSRRSPFVGAFGLLNVLGQLADGDERHVEIHRHPLDVAANGGQFQIPVAGIGLVGIHELYVINHRHADAAMLADDAAQTTYPCRCQAGRITNNQVFVWSLDAAFATSPESYVDMEPRLIEA